MTFVILKVVDALVGLRVAGDDEMNGLDISQHSESAYALGGPPIGEHVARSSREEEEPSRAFAKAVT
jgi:Amt family ammonium transporter